LTEPITAVLLRAAELTAAGKSRQAVEVLRPVVTAHPHHPEAWCRLAAAHLDVGDAADALDAATRALALGVDAAWAHRVAALALSELGRHDEAAVAARAAVRTKPSEWRCQVALAEVLTARPATGDETEATDAARRASELAPDQPRPFEVRGDIALRAGDWGAAEWAYRTALRLDPGAEHAKRNLALLGRQRSRRRGAPAASTGAPPLAAESVLWRLLVRLATVLAVGALLLVLVGPSASTHWLGSGGIALLVVLTAVTGRAVGRAPRGGLRPLARLVRRRAMLALATVLLGAALLVLVGWTVAVIAGTSTVQPLVPVLLCALLAMVVSVPGRVVLRHRRSRAHRPAG
jgi:Flp pilus assembly protein TadD